MFDPVSQSITHPIRDGVGRSIVHLGDAEEYALTNSNPKESISIHLGWGMSITMASHFVARQTSSRTDWGARILICWSAEKWRLWKLSTTSNQSKPTFLDGVCSSVPATNRPLPELFVSHWNTHKKNMQKRTIRVECCLGNARDGHWKCGRCQYCLYRRNSRGTYCMVVGSP